MNRLINNERRASAKAIQLRQLARVILNAAAAIKPATAARIPVKAALTALFSFYEVKNTAVPRMINNDGMTTPAAATTAPVTPARR